jgi:hypothetical protein
VSPVRVVLHPQGAPPGTLQAWVGVFGASKRPQLALEAFDSAGTALRAPVEVRAFDSVRGGAQLGDPDEPRAWTGTFAWTGVATNARHVVRCKLAGAAPAELETWTLPASFDELDDRELRVLLVSCYHASQDPGGLVGATAAGLAKRRIHLSLLLGDQVYLDLPTLRDFHDDSEWLARKFEDDYRANWSGDGYARVLDVAPSVSSPDDHEFWNNYPHRSPIIGNTWKKEGRERWKAAALAAYAGFQRNGATPPGRAVRIDVAPLSILVTDARSTRDEGAKFLLTPPARAELSEWVASVNRRDGFGMVVTGQSLWCKKASALQGQVADYELPNYGDYEEIVATLLRLRHDTAWITGDVHWGRTIRALDALRGRQLFELISSPSSLVANVASDWWKRTRAQLSNDPWPLHSEAETPIPQLAAAGVDARALAIDPRFAIHRQRGNHVALLVLRKSGDRLEGRIEYWPVRSNPARGGNVALELMRR